MTTPDPRYLQYPEYPYYPHYSHYAPPPAPPEKPRRTIRRRALAAGAALVVAVATVATVAVAESGGGGTIAGSGSTTQLLPSIQGGGSSGSSGGSSGGSTGRSGTSTSVTLASDGQKKGVVTIVSVLKYQNAESAGTGMILSSDGEILTNNHVVDGATSLTVTVASTGRSYRADVVGTDPSDDVAVLQLRNASGLPTANVGDSAAVTTGNTIVGVGNAGGTGTLRASSGTVTGLNQTITASDESGTNAETLHGLIGVNAPIIAGDSGGPMYDSAGEIIGMNTAAAQSRSAGPGGGSGGSGTSSSSAYAIPIDNALTIAKEIESGPETATLHIGLPAFIGVGVSDASGQGGGAAITSVLGGGPAAGAGITAGSVITKVGGTPVTSGTSLKTALAKHQPGSTVTIHWTGADGASHSAGVTLATGPAD